MVLWIWRSRVGWCDNRDPECRQIHSDWELWLIVWDVDRWVEEAMVWCKGSVLEGWGGALAAELGATVRVEE